MSNDNFEIEIIEETIHSNSKSISLPTNAKKIGSNKNSAMAIYIEQKVYDEIEKLALSDTERELGSVLLGDYVQDGNFFSVIISDFIEAKYCISTAATLKFTHETWEYIHKEHRECFADKRIVGWQHTHPGYGVFLSGHDLFIHENFFNLPFQIAYVVDPVSDTRGFFYWQDESLEKSSYFFIYDA